MKQYFNRNDREHHLFMLVAWDYLGEWVEKATCLTPSEKKRIKTALTLNEDYTKKLIKDAKSTQLRMVDNSNKRDADKELVSVELDDLYELANYSLADCRGCFMEDYHECEKYKILFKLNIPVLDEETLGCPYEQPQLKTIKRRA